MTAKPMNEEERQAAREATGEMYEALRGFLEAVRAEPELSDPVHRKAGAALERLGAAEQMEARRLDEADFTRDRLAELQREVERMRKLLAELYDTLEQEEWPAGA